MLVQATAKRNYRCFAEGQRFRFRSGINLLVGDQGTGKSTLIGGIVAAIEHQKRSIIRADDFLDLHMQGDALRIVCLYDIERMNPRLHTTHFQDVDFGLQSNLRQSSHGQCVNAILEFVAESRGAILLIDEPDQGLSCRSASKLIEVLKRAAARGNQVIASVHNPIVIGGFDKVLSMEHKKWVCSNWFLEKQIETSFVKRIFALRKVREVAEAELATA